MRSDVSVGDGGDDAGPARCCRRMKREGEAGAGWFLSGHRLYVRYVSDGGDDDVASGDDVCVSHVDDGNVGGGVRWDRWGRRGALRPCCFVLANENQGKAQYGRECR